MKNPYACCLTTFLLLFASVSYAQLPQCSTQKVNGNCGLVFDRLDPVSLPTIQMRKNARIRVTVVEPLPYETLTLDPSTFQAIAPSDQTQGFATAVFPSLKGVSTPVLTAKAQFLPHGGDPAGVAKVKQDLIQLGKYLDNPFPTVQDFIAHAQGFYGQLGEAVAPLPRPRGGDSQPVRAAAIPAGTPYPWANPYRDWLSMMLCELSAADCASAVRPSFTDLMATGITVQTLLTPPAPAPGATPPPPAAPLKFDTTTFDALANRVTNEIQALQPDEHPEIYAAELVELRGRETSLVVATPAYAAAWLPGVTAINKDLQTYFVNLKETASATHIDTQEVGYIDDPRRLSVQAAGSTHLLGRLVTYAINSVNQIAVMTTAVPTTTQKTSIATITVLFADPIFEVSTGTLFSSLPNRTFANQTLVNTHTGGIPTTGDIIITQSLIRPIVIPYVGANFRLGHDFLVGSRRSAVYFTTAVGFNAYNTTAEYAVGPSFSWRMIMLSPVFHIGHDVHLTQGETVDQVWCNTGAAAGSPTACVGSPPSPSSKTFWRGAFALGIGVRVPTSFGTTTGH
jgi:hypothetical protein